MEHPEHSRIELSFSQSLSSSQRFITTRERDAYFVIRGFVFQVERTIQRWLRLNADEVLILECGEDIDHISRVFVNGTWQEERELEQVKNREKNITLRTGCEPLANFVEHCRANSNQRLRFRFTTSASPTIERPPLSNDNRTGIELWREITIGEIEDAKRLSLSTAIKEFLLTCEKPKKVPDDTWACFQDFLYESDEAQWLDFIDQFEWETGITAPLELSSEIQRDMQQRGLAATSEEAKEIYERLLVHVFFLLSQQGPKRLEAEAWRAIGNRPLDAQIRIWLDRFTSDLKTLNTRIESLEVRTEQLEIITGQNSEIIASYETRLTHLEVTSPALPGMIQADQAASIEHLESINYQLAELTRTQTKEQLRNSPQARELEIEIRLEDTRQLLDEGKVRTAKSKLEQLLTQVRGLDPSPAKFQLWSRILGQTAFCAWREGEFVKAAQLYQEAYLLMPDDLKATVNAGYGALLVDKLEEALELGRKGLLLNSASDDAFSVTIRALNRLNRDPEIEELMSQYPEAAKGQQALFTLGGIAIEREDYSAAQTYAERACTLSGEHPNAQRLKCDAYLSPIMHRMRNDPPLLNHYSEQERVHLEIAEDAATRAIEGMRAWETHTLTLEALCNRAVARKVLGKIEEGLSDCEEMLSISPGNPLALLTKGEILLHDKQDSKAAIEFLSQVKEGHWAEDAAVLQAEAHVNLGEWSHIFNVLDTIYRPATANRSQIDLARLLIQAAFFSKDTERLQALKEDLETHYPGDTAALAILADLARYEEDFPRCIALFQKVYSQAEGERRERAAFLLGQAYACNKEFDKALELLLPLLDLERAKQQGPNPILLFSLQILRLAGRKKEAHDIALQVRNNGRAIADVSEYEADYCVDIGERNHAMRLFEELSEDHPHETIYARNVAALALQGEVTPEHIEVARSALNRISLDLVRNDSSALMDFARFRYKAGFADALEWAYLAVRRSPNDPDIAAEYLEYVFTEVNGNEPRFHHEEVEAECAVELRRRRQNEIWIITREPSADPRDLPLDHPFTRLLLGKRPGDIVSLSEERPMNPEPYEVVSIKSKYVQMSHDLTHKMEGGILQSKRMVVGHFHLPNTVEGARQDREELREKIESGISLSQLYKDHKIPLATVAHMSGVTVADFWKAESSYGGYRVIPTGQFFVFNAEGSNEDVRALCSSSTALVLDWTALITTIHLGLEDTLFERYERLFIASELATEVSAYVRRQQRGDEDFEDQDTLHDQHRRQFAHRLQLFANRCQKVPVSDWTEDDEELTKMYGRAAVATFKLAQQQEIPLWADDFHLRSAGRKLYRISGYEIQTVMCDLLVKGLVCEEREHEVTLSITLANYGIPWLSKPFLLWVLRRNHINITKEVRRVFRSFAYWEINTPIAVRMIASVFVEVCKNTLFYEQRQQIAFAMLDALVEGRPKDRVIALLVKHIETSLIREPLRVLVGYNLITNWYATQIVKT